MTSFTAKTKLTETSKCSFISNRRTGEECGKMTVAKLRIGWSRDILYDNFLNRTMWKFIERVNRLDIGLTSGPISAGSKTDFKYSYYCRDCIIKAHFNLHTPSIKIELIDPDKGYVHYPTLRIWFSAVS